MNKSYLAVHLKFTQHCELTMCYPLLRLVAQPYQVPCNPVDCSPTGSSAIAFSRQEYSSGLPCPPPGNLLNPGIEPRFPALQAD